MQLTIKRTNLKYIFLILGVLTIITTLVTYRVTRVEELTYGECTVSQSDFPFIVPSTTAYLSTPDDLWRGYYLQPVITDFETSNGVNYIRTQYLDYNSECQYLDLIYSGDLVVEDRYEIYDNFNKNFLSDKSYSFEEIQKELEIGTQIQIMYQYDKPEINDENCNAFDQGSQIHCTIQQVNEHFHGEEGFKFIDNKFNQNILFIGRISTELTSI